MKKIRFNTIWVLLIVLICLAVASAIIAGMNLSKSSAESKKNAVSEIEPTYEIELVLPDSADENTETVETVGKENTVGTFYSKTGTSLNLGIKWYLSPADNNTYNVYFDIYINCRNLNIGGKTNGLTISINGETYTLDSKDIAYSGNEATFIQVGEYNVNVPASAFKDNELPAEITYNFGGTYAGQQIDTITATGSVKLINE